MRPANTPQNRLLSVDDLDRGIVNLAAQINAATYELLVLVRQFDERAGWLKWGFANCAEWLHWRCDLSMSAAREKVRVAHALKVLPLISESFSTGELLEKALDRARDATASQSPELADEPWPAQPPKPPEGADMSTGEPTKAQRPD